jgi:hypothetical protein
MTFSSSSAIAAEACEPAAHTAAAEIIHLRVMMSILGNAVDGA